MRDEASLLLIIHPATLGSASLANSADDALARAAADFDTIGKPTGSENARFADFSSKAVRAANVKIGEFLKLMPADELEAARSQVAAMMAPPPDDVPVIGQ